MFDLIGLVTVLILLAPFALLIAFACLAGTLFKGIGWLALGAVKFVVGGIFLLGMLLLGLCVIPFALFFG